MTHIIRSTEILDEIFDVERINAVINVDNDEDQQKIKHSKFTRLINIKLFRIAK